MKILAAGGGSGGHVTPVVAVLKALKQQKPRAEIRFWCDTGFAPQARRIMGHYDDSIPVETIISGKLRRYHHLPWWRHITMVRAIFLPNLIDAVKLVIGVVQSLVKLLLWRPDVVFSKGGYVCLPIGIAAHWLRIPLVIHDSDAHPGATNRILARWADAIGTGAPVEFYPYPHERTHYVGVPIGPGFAPVSPKEQTTLKRKIGVDPAKPLLVVTGGGLGAKRINDAVALSLAKLLDVASVVLISGTKQYDELRSITPQDDPRYQLISFVSEGMDEILGAADIVVARAGATFIAELAALAKPTILIPNPHLTGGHQLKNAAVYEQNGAAIVLDEALLERDPDMLVTEVRNVLADTSFRRTMQKNFAKFAKPHAARDMARLITGVLKRGRTR